MSSIPIPAELALDKATPSGQKFKLELRAIGVQVYVCRPVKDANGKLTGAFEWDLKEPIADLFDGDGRLVGRHFRDRENDGAAWLSILDGSKVVVGRPVRKAVPHTIDWLLVPAKFTSGAPGGSFADVKSVHRLATLGGQKPPQASATAAREGDEVRVYYSATYYFNA